MRIMSLGLSTKQLSGWWPQNRTKTEPEEGFIQMLREGCVRGNIAVDLRVPRKLDYRVATCHISVGPARIICKGPYTRTWLQSWWREWGEMSKLLRRTWQKYLGKDYRLINYQSCTYHFCKPRSHLFWTIALAFNSKQKSYDKKVKEKINGKRLWT
jgi:hypothetical protein